MKSKESEELMLSKLKKIVASKDQVLSLANFIILLIVFILYKVSWRVLEKLKLANSQAAHTGVANKIIGWMDRHEPGTISKVYVIEMSLRNMQVKKTRTFITVGGMAIGVGAIVFLVSLGYGLQNLVISRIARLDEMKQADVVPQPGGKIKINDKTMGDFKNVKEVSQVLPMIAVVGRVNYQNSISDMAVYGVTSEYLKQSAIKPSEGKIFESNDLSVQLPEDKGKVSGAKTERVMDWGEEIDEVEFNVFPEEWARVRKGPSTKSETLGYTSRTGGKIQGRRVWGGSFDSDNDAGSSGTSLEGETLGRWIEGQMPLWQKSGNTYVQMKDDTGAAITKLGYVAEINISYETMPTVDTLKVLGWESGDVLAATDEATLSLEEIIASESATAKQSEAKIVQLGAEAKRQAVVNRAMLKILNIKENDAIGKKFTTSFIITSSLLADSKEKVESAPAEYTIVGVTPDERTPIFYVPFVDLRMLGITNFSQIKMVAKSQGELKRARNVIETMGFSTRSVADTVAQVNSLFNTLRTVMALLGMVALAVAALGMFNTLTVSLLERTREVGLMKAMGMKSHEVQELFLTESMIMGFFGGIVGIIVGIALGKLLGLLLTALAVFKGAGTIDISYVPLGFMSIVVGLSLFVGILTGLYPAKRATKISALDALRYE